MARTNALALAALSSVAVLAVVTVASSAAAAVAAPDCNITVLKEGASLPSNAPALIVSDASHGGAKATVSAELVSSEGRVAFVGPTKDAHGLTILQFANPAAGAYKIATKVACSNGRDTESETSVVLTAPVAFPTSVGTISVLPNADPRGLDEIVLEPMAELRAFMPVSVIQLVVEGDDRKTTGYSANPAEARVTFNAHTGRVCVENGSLLRDKRIAKVTVSATIAGLAASPAPTTLDVPVDCGAIKWTSDSDNGRGSNVTPPPGSTPLNPNDDTAGNGNGNGNGTDAGCSAAPVGVLSGNAAALVAGAVAVLAGLRRRRPVHR